MNLLCDEARALAESLSAQVGSLEDRDVAIFPTFTSISELAKTLANSPIRMGGQNLFHQDQGAFTGEISGDILRSAGATTVIVGHSERRQVLGESNSVVNLKVKAALRHDLDVILCVGEVLEERENHQSQAVVETQLQAGLAGISDDEMKRVTVAYEPVWAIGTGKTATPDTAQEIHAAIRDLLRELYSEDVASATRIQYGGSVKANNVDELMAMPDIDGALVGGASLDVESFARIVGFNKSAT